jgi:hypothetical protein
MKRTTRRTLSEFDFAVERGETTGTYGKPAEHWQNFRDAIEGGTARAVEKTTRRGKSLAWEIEDTDPTGRTIDTGSHAHGTRGAQEYVRDRKTEELRAGASPADVEATVKPWRNFGEMRQYFDRAREQVGETRYFEELELAGVQNPGQFKSSGKALECYSRLVRLAAKEVA